MNNDFKKGPVQALVFMIWRPEDKTHTIFIANLETCMVVEPAKVKAVGLAGLKKYFEKWDHNRAYGDAALKALLKLAPS